MGITFDFSQSKAAVTHTTAFYAGLGTAYVTRADIVNNPETQKATSYKQDGQVVQSTVLQVGEFYGEDITSYLPGSNFVYSLSSDLQYSFKINASIGTMPNINSYIGSLYESFSALQAAAENYSKAYWAWVESIDARPMTTVEFRGLNGASGLFTSTSPVALVQFTNNLATAMDGADHIIGSRYNDILQGGRGADIIQAGLGQDAIVFNAPKPLRGVYGQENHDGDSTVVVKTADGTDTISDAEIARFTNGDHSMVRIAMTVDRNADGTGTLSIYRNEKLWAATSILHDTATPLQTGSYWAYYDYSSKVGKVIEFETTRDGIVHYEGSYKDITRTNIDIHGGVRIGNSEGCFIITDATIRSKFFAMMQKEVGFDLPSAGSQYFPVVPIAIDVTGAVKQPYIKGVDKTISLTDAGNLQTTARFSLANANGGLQDKKIDIYFSVDANSVGRDFKFNDTNVSFIKKLTNGTATLADDVNVYKATIGADDATHKGKAFVDLKIEILSFSNAPSKTISFDMIEVDLWRYSSGLWKQYDVSAKTVDVSDYDGNPSHTAENLFLAPTVGDRSIDLTINHGASGYLLV